jgi:uncharacterized protein (DUF2249 family)
MPKDLKITLQIECEGEFPWSATSNTDWQNGAEVSMVTQEKASQLTSFY